MNKLSKNAMQFLWWLGRFMHLWVRSTVFPAQLKSALGLDLTKPVVYVLRNRSLTDLLVLDQQCRSAGLPRPEYNLWSLLGHAGGAYLYLTTPGLLQRKRGKLLPTSLYRLVSEVERRQDEVQLVPVSVFWGRNPGKEEKSLFKFMFFDDEHGGFFQRFFTFFLQGRNVFCNFGQPISMRKLVGEGLPPEETSKKLRRVLRVHFRTQRDIVLGPHIYNRRQVIASLVQSPRLKEVISAEAQKRNLPYERIEAQAYKYADEVTSRFSHHALRFLDIVLTWLWRRIYNGVEVRHGERLRAIAQNYELVYMASHRSHMDYLLLGYVLYYLGLMPPHTVAGINMNFWPIGPLLRRGGAIFIRRTFRGNRLYSMVVSEFVHYLITTGFPIGFYPEGGRSRTGRLLKPKMGILNMVVQSYRRNPRRPIMLVPIYIGYDKVMEVHSYRHELHGQSKKKESMRDLLKLPKVLRSQLGKAYIGIGEPLELGSYLLRMGVAPEPELESSAALGLAAGAYGHGAIADAGVAALESGVASADAGVASVKTRRESTLGHASSHSSGAGANARASHVVADDERNSKALAPVVAKIAKEVAIRTNEAAILTPVALFSTILLACPKKALSEAELLHVARTWLGILAASSPAASSNLCIDTAKLSDELRYAELLAGLARFRHPTGDVIYINKGEDGFVLNYYRNNTLHLFVLPALWTALMPPPEEAVDAQALGQRVWRMFLLLREEFLLPLVDEQGQAALAASLEALVAHGLILREGQALRRPGVMAPAYSPCRLLALVISEDAQRYALYATLLVRYLPMGRVAREQFEDECQLMSQRLSILEGMSDRPLHDGQSLRNFLETLSQQGYIQANADDLSLKPELAELASSFANLVSSELSFHPASEAPTLTPSPLPPTEGEKEVYGTLENPKI